MHYADRKLKSYLMGRVAIRVRTKQTKLDPKRIRDAISSASFDSLDMD